MKNLSIPKKLQRKLRGLDLKNIESIGSYRHGEDLVLADGYVDHHTDNTETGKDSIMTVLINDGEYIFNYDGKTYDMDAGWVFRFDGNKDHALLTMGRSGRFAAIIWDVPDEKQTESFIPDLQSRIKELNNTM
jgi:hypothetical protein